MAEDKDRCWPGYEPVPGKPQHSQGSCRPKADSKLSSGEKKFRSKRDEQLAEWKKEHPGSPKKAAQHLHKPGTTPKTTAKKATKKASVKKATPKKAASKKAVAKKSASTKKSASRKAA